MPFDPAGPEGPDERPDQKDRLGGARSERVSMSDAITEAERLTREIEKQLLSDLRNRRRSLREQEGSRHQPPPLTLGQRIADRVAAIMGSWTFIICQSVVLAIWIVLNVAAWMQHWDPYPFILLNLALSFQAAYTAPVIMMSQNRQQDIDRKSAEEDHMINLKAELEIELLHQKMDVLREKEVYELTVAIRELTEQLRQARQG